MLKLQNLIKISVFMFILLLLSLIVSATTYFTPINITTNLTVADKTYSLYYCSDTGLKTCYPFSYILGNSTLTLNNIMTNIGNWSKDKSGLQNLSLQQIVTNIGNWSANSGSYYTSIQINSIISGMPNLTLILISNNIGNWSQDKINVFPNITTLTIQMNSLPNLSLGQIVTNTGNFSAHISNVTLHTVQIASMPNLSYGQIATNLGNWSSSMVSYYTATQINTLFSSLPNLTLSTISTNIGNWTLDKNVVFPNITTLMVQMLSLTNLSLSQIVTNIGNFSANSANVTLHATQIASLANLSLSQIVANIGNWTLDKSSYYTTLQVNSLFSSQANLTLLQISTNIGNWTGDKSSYYTSSQVNTIISSLPNLSLEQIVTNSGNWSKDKGGLPNLSLQNIKDNLGNFSANSANLTICAYQIASLVNLTLGQVSDNLGNWTKDKGTLPNLTYEQIKNNVGNWSNDKSGYVLKGSHGNITLDGANITTGQINASKIDGAITRDSEVPGLETDSAHDTCGEVTGCAVGAITDGNTNWDNSYGFYNSMDNFSTALEDGKICIYNFTLDKITCNYTDKEGGEGTGNITGGGTTNKVCVWINGTNLGDSPVTISGSDTIFGGGIRLGTTADETGGNVRYISASGQFQGYNGTDWSPLGGTGGGTVDTTCEDTVCDLSDDGGYLFKNLSFTDTTGFSDFTDNDCRVVDSCTNISYDHEINKSYIDTEIDSLPNLSLQNVKDNLGNWSLDDGNVLPNISKHEAQITSLPNLSLQNIEDNLGNVSSVSSNITLQAAQIASMPNLSLSNVVTNAGNWSADKGGVYNVIGGNYTAALAEITKNRSISAIFNLTGTDNCGSGTVIQNISVDYTGITISCLAAAASLSLNDIVTNIGNWSADKGGVYADIAGNLSLAYGAVDSNITVVNNKFASLPNLSYSQIVTNSGNWSADKINVNPNITKHEINITTFSAQIVSLVNLSLNQIMTNIGNWTLDKVNVLTNITTLMSQMSSLSNLTYGQIATNLGNYSSKEGVILPNITKHETQINSMPNLSLSGITTNAGNWSADKSGVFSDMANNDSLKFNVTGGTITGDTSINSKVNISSGTGSIVTAGNYTLDIGQRLCFRNSTCDCCRYLFFNSTGVYIQG